MFADLAFASTVSGTTEKSDPNGGLKNETDRGWRQLKLAAPEGGHQKERMTRDEGGDRTAKLTFDHLLDPDTRAMVEARKLHCWGVFTREGRDPSPRKLGSSSSRRRPRRRRRRLLPSAPTRSPAARRRRPASGTTAA